MAKTALNDYFDEVNKHYSSGFQETERRRTGRGRVGSISFDEADELFRSWIDESKWPYDALLFDPRVFTFIFEKTARLLGSRLRGELVPREGGDVLGAKINNQLLDYQWDNANHGGSMLTKWALLDLNARKYGASFAICKWRYELSADGKCIFDGPEMKVLNNRDCAHEISATNIEDCNWFQVREYITFQDLKRVNDASRGKPAYENLDRLGASIELQKSSGKDYQSANWISRNRSISGLELSPASNEIVFQRVEIVTEYRRDKWITFAPKHGVVLRAIDNPYKNSQIPIALLKYYVIDDDMYGLSEIEPVKSLQKAINAILCQYVDEINMKLYTPVAISPGVRQATLEWGKGARWLMNNPMTDFRLVESQSAAAQYFNNTYSALVAAMMNALGESSLGVSNIDRYQADKTATEIKQLISQRNARDNFNQMYLAEAIKRQMMLWHQMNQIMLFTDPKKTHEVVRVVGKDAAEFFKQQGLGSYGVSSMGAEMAQENPGLTAEDQKVPIYPIDVDGKSVPKFSMENGIGKLYIEPKDLSGNYDYIADVRSMAINSGEEEKAARDKAFTALITNQNVLSYYYSTLYKHNRFFEDAPQQAPQPQQQGGGMPQPGGEQQQVAQSLNQTGLMGAPENQIPNINLETMNNQAMARELTAPPGMPMQVFNDSTGGIF